jgi:hypothetical protein
MNRFFHNLINNYYNYIWLANNSKVYEDVTHQKELGKVSPSVGSPARHHSICNRSGKENGVVQYPDANSTMRITYGRVLPIKPRDAVSVSWQSTAAGLPG